MQLKVKIKINDDRTYRDSLHPYDIYPGQLMKDVQPAIDRALDRLNHDDSESSVATVKHYGDVVGTVKVTVE